MPKLEDLGGKVDAIEVWKKLERLDVRSLISQGKLFVTEEEVGVCSEYDSETFYG